MYKKFVALISVWAWGRTIVDPMSIVMKLIQAKYPQTPSPSDYQLELSADGHSRLAALASQTPPILPPGSSSPLSDSTKSSAQPALFPNHLPSPRCQVVTALQIRRNDEIVR